MRGALIVGIVIAMLIVGILVMKNIQPSPHDGPNREKAIERAEKAAESAEKAIGRITKDSERAADY